jgi:hypothetical protein
VPKFDLTGAVVRKCKQANHRAAGLLLTLL